MANDDVAGGLGTRSGPAAAPATDFFDRVRPCSTMGVGSLPHRDVAAGARFGIDAFDVLTLPSLPRRSPAEAPVAQALAGTDGIAVGQYGSVSIDVERLGAEPTVRTDIARDEFAGLRSAVALAASGGHDGPVKWQFVGPISVGVTLRRAGVQPTVAFDLATSIVRAHLAALFDLVAEALPDSPQLVVLDEPLLDGMLARDFPIAPDEAIDLLSSAMAVVGRRAAVGVHTCGDVDLATLIAPGPDLISVPARSRLVAGAGYLSRFLRNGGWVAWGAVTTEGPIGATGDRAAGSLCALWNALAERGVDQRLLRERALITPQCGLGGHGLAAARDVVAATAAVTNSLATR